MNINKDLIIRISYHLSVPDVLKLYFSLGIKYFDHDYWTTRASVLYNIDPYVYQLKTDDRSQGMDKMVSSSIQYVRRLYGLGIVEIGSDILIFYDYHMLNLDNIVNFYSLRQNYWNDIKNSIVELKPDPLGIYQVADYQVPEDVRVKFDEYKPFIGYYYSFIRDSINMGKYDIIYYYVSQITDELNVYYTYMYSSLHKYLKLNEFINLDDLHKIQILMTPFSIYPKSYIPSYIYMDDLELFLQNYNWKTRGLYKTKYKLPSLFRNCLRYGSVEIANYIYHNYHDDIMIRPNNLTIVDPKSIQIFKKYLTDLIQKFGDIMYALVNILEHTLNINQPNSDDDYIYNGRVKHFSNLVEAIHDSFYNNNYSENKIRSLIKGALPDIASNNYGPKSQQLLKNIYSKYQATSRYR